MFSADRPVLVEQLGDCISVSLLSEAFEYGDIFEILNWLKGYLSHKVVVFLLSLWAKGSLLVECYSEVSLNEILNNLMTITPRSHWLSW